MAEVEMLTIEEAAAFLRISKSTLYNLVRSEDVPAYRIGRRLLFTEDMIRGYLEKNRTTNARGGP